MDRSRASCKSEKVVMLRVFEPKDLYQVKSLIESTIDAVYSHYPVEFIDYWKNSTHSESSILGDARIGFVVVAELDLRILGTGTLLGKEISRVFVTPDFQRRGIVKLIMNRLERRAAENGVKVVYLASTAVFKAFNQLLGYSVFEGEVFSNEGPHAVGYFRMKKTLE
jgi:GNAT superfamily N-acetyltransferase